MYAVLGLLLIWGVSIVPAFSQTDYSPLPDRDYEIQSLLIDRFINCSQVPVPYERCLVFVYPITDTYYLNDNCLTDLKEQIAKQGKLASFIPSSSWAYFLMSIEVGRFKKYAVDNKFSSKTKQTALFNRKTNQSNRFVSLRKDHRNLAATVSISNVAYSLDKTKALCYFSNAIDEEARAGYIVFLEKRADTWFIVNKHLLWIS
jgi:hypothetical protein